MERPVIFSMTEMMNRWGGEHRPFFFIFDYEMKYPEVIPLDELDGDILYDLRGMNNSDRAPKQDRDYRFGKTPPTFDRYKTAFDHIQRHQRMGNSYLANLTLPSEIDTDLTLNEIFHRSVAPYKLKYRELFTVFSPEAFVRIENGRISTTPMKGTIDASVPDAEQTILNDEKESAEHLTVVDLMRNDLNRVSKNVRVDRFRWIEKVKTRDREFLQVSSTISGELAQGYESRLGDILSDLLPAGSICGAPKPKTLEIIREAEQYERGYYTGVFGVFDGKTLDSAVMIRYIERTSKGFVYKSGGGITVDSDPVKEYKELVDKIYVPII